MTMLVPGTVEAGAPLKLVCPECEEDAIGESGMGVRYVHCFGRCMKDIVKEGCPAVPVRKEELPALLQEAY
jgi:hypothetical protein